MSCCRRFINFLCWKKDITITLAPDPPKGTQQKVNEFRPSIRPTNQFEPWAEPKLDPRPEPQPEPRPEPRPEPPPLKNERRPGVPVQPTNQEKNLENVEIVKFEKDKSTETFIKTSLLSNEFLRNILDGDRLQQVVDAMRAETVAAKEYVIREGEPGNHLYVSEDGSFEVTKDGMIVKKFKGGETFGELAILYNQKRFASIQALTRGKIWVLDRTVYQKIMLKTAIEDLEANIEFLNNVPLFSDVSSTMLSKVANLLKREFFSTGSVIVRQGDRGDKFYIIKVGSVLITKRSEEGAIEENVGTLKQGEFFGELALLQEDYRRATVTAQAPGVECLTLDRNNFIEIFGNFEKIKKDYTQQPKVEETTTSRKPDYSYIRFDDLDIVATLGCGGFGRVELVQYRSDRNLTFALKYLKKIDMVQQQQQEHAYNEKMIMLSCNSDFICKLYKTYRDAKYIYFLMEVCLGGDVWTLLQKQRNKTFDDNVTRFMGACVVEAFNYLHSRDIIYRDLKPENLLIDSDGYIKLVDFGFAKKLGARGKTFTFAGTPEYVAPEIILNRGHDKGVDYWALGIFLHELHVGKPPFRAHDHMKTYNMIVRGIDQVNFPAKMPKALCMLIRKLCRSVPQDRLGWVSTNDIKNNKFFVGFDWEALVKKQMVAPIKPTIKHCLDVENFDKYPKDTDIPPDEVSGWDQDF